MTPTIPKINNAPIASSEKERLKMARQAEANRKLIRQQPNFRREKSDSAEPRSRRMQLLVKPSIYDRLQEIARKESVSVNQIAERAFMSYAEKHKSEDAQ